MRKIITLYLVIFAFNFVNAQEIENEKVFNKQLTFGVLGNTGLLIYKSGFDKKYSKRITFSGSYKNNTNHTINYNSANSPGVNNLYNIESVQTNFGYGLQKNIKIQEKLDFFYALDFILGVKYENVAQGWEMEDSLSYADFTGQTNSYYNGYFNISNGDYVETEVSYYLYSLNLQPAIGINYKVADRLMLGLEYRISLVGVNYFSGYIYSYSSYLNDVETKLKKSQNAEFGCTGSIDGRTAATVTYLF